MLEDVKKKVKAALDELIKNDLFLLKNDLNERSVSHKLAVHLEPLFKEWNIDCEYNQDHDKVKCIKLPIDSSKSDDTQAKTVFPDIIIHRRNKKDNLLVIEIKKSKISNFESTKFDLIKLKAYRKDLGYEYTLFVLFYESVIDDKYYKPYWNPDKSDNLESLAREIVESYRRR